MKIIITEMKKIAIEFLYKKLGYLWLIGEE